MEPFVSKVVVVNYFCFGSSSLVGNRILPSWIDEHNLNPNDEVTRGSLRGIVGDDSSERGLAHGQSRSSSKSSARIDLS